MTEEDEILVLFFEKALKAIQKIQDEYWQGKVLAELVPYLPEPLLKEALKLARNIKDSEALAAIAIRLAEIGQPKRALNLVGDLKLAYQQLELLRKLAPQLAEARQLEKLLNPVGNIKDKYEYIKTLVALAPFLPESVLKEKLDEALSVAKSIKVESSRAEALAALAPYLPESLLEEVLYLTQNLENNYEQSIILAAIVPQLAKFGHLQEALKMALNIKYKHKRTDALVALALWLAKNEQPQEALNLVQNIEDKYKQSETLAKLVPLLSIPKPLLKQALVVWNNRKERRQNKLLVALVNELAGLGYLEEALAIAHIHSGYWRQAELLAELVSRFVELPPNIRNHFWQAILRELKVANSPENDRLGASWDFAHLLFEDLCTLLPVLAALGGVVAVAEAFCLLALKLRQAEEPKTKTFEVTAGIFLGRAFDFDDWFKPKLTTQPEETVHQFTRLIRYSNLDCPKRNVINQRFSLFIQLLIKPPLEEETEAVEVQDTGVLKQLPEVEIVLRAHGFDIVGSNTKILHVERDDDSEERFLLIPRCLGEQELRVDFYQHGRRLSTIRHSMLVMEKFEEEVLPQQPPITSIELKTKPVISPPDLELCVELDRQDNRTLYFTLHSAHSKVGYHHTKLGQVTLQGSPLEKMQAAYQELSQLARPMQQTEQALAERRLAALGNKLWDELIPDQLKQEYWRFKSHIKTILVTSDEPWIPWEAIKPYRFNNDSEREEDSFWCQQFAISRWLSGPGTADELLVGTARPIAPTQSNLAAVQEEVAFIKQLHNLHPAIATLEPCSNSIEVLDWLETGKFSISHFACHGTFDATSTDNSAIMLSGIALRPSDVRARFGGRRMRPLIFINACHAARVEFSFTGLGGWAERLVKDAHVGAFVGAMWEVNDGLALRFAQRFYTAILQDNQNIAEAFRSAREEIRQLAPYNSSWLAYALYADPESKVKDDTTST